jgi:hypothetical protein
MRIDWRGDVMVLHVLDCGAGFAFLPELPRDPMSERGRGLFIVNSLVEHFHSKPASAAEVTPTQCCVHRKTRASPVFAH